MFSFCFDTRSYNTYISLTINELIKNRYLLIRDIGKT